jgi:hypothetical protein
MGCLGGLTPPSRKSKRMLNLRPQTGRLSNSATGDTLQKGFTILSATGVGL